MTFGRGLLCSRCMQLQRFLLQRNFSTTACVTAGGKWRQQQGEDPSGNRYGPLADTPDWSYADGRPAPIEPHKQTKLEERKKMAKNIMDMMEQMKFAKKRYAEMTEAQKQIKQAQLEKKLKAKAPSV